MITRLISILCSATLLLFAYSDSDMDGVEDYEDKCPNTPFNELVDYNGCSKSDNDERINYTVVLGMQYAQKNYSSRLNDDTQYIYLQNNFSYLDWNLQVIASYYRLENEDSLEYGLNDTSINLSYQIISSKDFSLSLGTGVILPTYKSPYHNEATDYMLTVNTRYLLNTQSYIFANYTYTFINDKDIKNISYEDIQSYQIGVGFMPKYAQMYTLAYSYNNSIYSDIEAIQELRAGVSLTMDKNLFGGINYNYGLSKSASNHTFGCYIGYSF